MKIPIPNWIKKSWKYFMTGAGAAAGTALVVLMPHTPEQFTRQIVVGLDTTIVITGSDTARHATTEDDLHAVYRSAEKYDDGYRLHVWEYKTINTLTGEVTPELLLTIASPIGMQVNWKARAGRSELAAEKIPEKLDGLLDIAGNDSLCNAIGWYAVKDTVELDKTGDVLELKRRWTADKAAKGERVKYVAPVEGEVGGVEP